MRVTMQQHVRHRDESGRTVEQRPGLLEEARRLGMLLLLVGCLCPLHELPMLVLAFGSRVEECGLWSLHDFAHGVAQLACLLELARHEVSLDLADKRARLEHLDVARDRELRFAHLELHVDKGKQRGTPEEQCVRLQEAIARDVQVTS